MIEKDEYIPPVKDLPKNNQGQYKATFQANGTEYRIYNPEFGFPLSRDTDVTRFIIMVLSNSDYNYTVNNLVTLEGLFDEWTRQNKKIGDISAHITAWKNNVLEISTAKYLWWHYLCTTFILAPGEDINTEWDQAAAEKKLNDWAVEGYKREAFMELAGLFIEAYNIESAKLSALIQEVALQALTGEGRLGNTAVKRGK